MNVAVQLPILLWLISFQYLLNVIVKMKSCGLDQDCIDALLILS